MLRILILGLMVQDASSQRSASIPASIGGVVVRLGSNEPIAGANVELSRLENDGSSTAGNLWTATTADDGKFAFPNLQAGSYRLIATQSGGAYVPAEYGQREPRKRGLTIELAPGQTLKDARLPMAATGTISGRVLDIDSEPISNARVMALEVFYRDGRRSFSIVQAIPTNDLGEYRLFWLPPGRYYVGVMPVDRRTSSFAIHVNPPSRSGTREDASSPVVTERILENGVVVEEMTVPVYYGGGPDPKLAQPIDLAPGANVGAVDIVLNDAKVRSHRIHGVVIDGTTGQPAASASLRLIPRDPGPHFLIPNGDADKKGLFELAGVTPGSYFLFATIGAGTGTGLGQTIFDGSRGKSGRTVVNVSDTDLDNVTVVISPPFKLDGKVLVEGSRSDEGPLDLTRLRVDLTRDPDILGMPSASPVFRSNPNEPLSGAVSSDGAFTLHGFGQGEYRVSIASVPQDAHVTSIRLGSLDILSSGLHVEAQPEGEMEIVISTNGGELAGLVTNDKQVLSANVTVALVPDAVLRTRTDLYKTASTDASGRFRIRGIPPGDYKVFAWENVATNAWQNPEFIRDFETRAKAIHIGERSRENVTITVIQ